MHKFIKIFLLFSCLLPLSAVSAATLQDKKLASSFLLRTTFGPTMDEINLLADRVSLIGAVPAFTEWVDQQMLLPASSHKRLAKQMEMTDREHFNWNPDRQSPEYARVGPARYKRYTWWHVAITSPDQLRQRMAWALSQIFVVSTVGNDTFNSDSPDMSGQGHWQGISDYYDKMVDNSFGNYRNLIQDVTLHPVMGRYLSHARNPKGDGISLFPDENYAREVMQLFSIGLNKLNIDGTWQTDANGELIDTYDNAAIENFARVFTGLSYEPNTPTPNYGQGFNGTRLNYNQPMIMYEDYHDTDSKTLLDGTILPAGQSGMQDINDGLDNLFNHANVGPFMARRLIQRFVMSNPSKAYIQAVTEAFNNNGSGIRGDLSAVLKTVLLHNEAIASLTIQDSEHSRLREPILRYASLLRAFSPVSDYFTGRLIVSSFHKFDQSAYRAPHVFNFYLPDYQSPGDIVNNVPSAEIPNGKLFAPEYEILNAVTANELANWIRTVNRGFGTAVPHGGVNYYVFRDPQTSLPSLISYARTNLDQSDQNSLASDGVALVENLDLLLCGGGLSDETKTTISANINLLAPTLNNPKLYLRTKAAILGVVMSPGCAVQ